MPSKCYPLLRNVTLLSLLQCLIHVQVHVTPPPPPTPVLCILCHPSLVSHFYISQVFDIIFININTFFSYQNQD